MVDIAQPVEHLIVVQKVARSSRVIHPINPGFARGFVFSSRLVPAQLQRVAASGRSYRELVTMG